MKKDKLEQFFSDKLENFEAPYSQEAWTSLESKLGNSAGSTGLSVGAKIALFSAAAIVVAVVTYVALPEKTENSIQPIAQTEQTVDKNTIEENESTHSQIQNGDVVQTQATDENSLTIDVNNPSVDPATNESNVASSNTNVTEPTNNETVNVNNESNSTTPNNVVVNDSKVKYINGNISSTLICKGESITISNLGNEKDVVRFLLNGKTTQLSKGKKTSVAIDAETEIAFTNDKNEVISKERIQVLDNPKPNFDFDANIYENGLPIAKFISYGNYKNITWDFGNSQYAQGAEATTYYFDKGVYQVKMTATDINGCVGSEVKNVEITDKYNLLATNSIRLNDPNLETRTFMPFCLKERDVKFTLTIIDPKDNAVVFTTKDASKAWDGTDQRTGRILPPFKTFIWQVHLDETMPGERGIYNGTVTIVE